MLMLQSAPLQLSKSPEPRWETKPEKQNQREKSIRMPMQGFKQHRNGNKTRVLSPKTLIPLRSGQKSPGARIPQIREEAGEVIAEESNNH